MRMIENCKLYNGQRTVFYKEAERLGELDVIPGMPVEVFIFSGTHRTTLDYLFEPISESLFRGARRG